MSSIKDHPLPWFLGSVIAAFFAGAATYQAIISWTGQKVVLDETTMKLAVRVEATPQDATVSLGPDPDRSYYPGMPLPDGPYEFFVSSDGYRPETVRLARNGGTLVLAVPLSKIPHMKGTDSVVYMGETLSINAQEIDVRTLFQIIGDFTGTKIRVSDAVQGTIAISLKEIPRDQVIDLVTSNAGLELRRSGNVTFVDVSR